MEHAPHVEAQDQESKPDEYTRREIETYLESFLSEFGSSLGDFPEDDQERWIRGLWDLIDAEAVWRATGGK